MTARKCVALGVLSWVSLGTIAHASPGSWTGGSLPTSNQYGTDAWYWWVSGQLQSQAVDSLNGTPISALSGPPPALISPVQPAQLPPSPVYTSATSDVPNNAHGPAVSAASTMVNVAPQSGVTSSASTSGAAYDAVLNFGNGPFPDQSSLTSGGAQPWYLSPAVDKFFNGVPNAQQQSDFQQAVLQHVQKTFQLSGINPSISLNTSAPANHVMSEVSSTSYGPNSQAIGITNVGGNGFGFIDKLGGAQTLDQLEWAVAHNMTHELMHAFGVAVHHDATGNYLDAGTASMSLLTDPTAALSQAAAQDIMAHNYGRNLSANGMPGAQEIDGDQVLTTPQPVPEPSTIAFWVLGSLGLAVSGKRLSRRKSAC